MVVAGGVYERDNVLILDVESRQWRSGPPLPYQGRLFASVIQEEDSFLIVGGFDPVDVTGDILQFDEADEAWVLRQERLSTPRADFFAIEIDNEGYEFCPP